jgi:hypothetical protein
MEKLIKQIFTVKSILTIALVGGAAYYILKKKNESKDKPLLISEVDSDGNVSEVRGSEETTTKTTQEEAELECEKSMANIRVSEEGKIKFITDCVRGKIS